MSDVEGRDALLPSLREALVAAAGEQEQRRGGRVREMRRVLSIGAAVAAAAVVIVVLVGVLAPDDAIAGVTVRRDGGSWVVTVSDATVAASDVEAELERHGIAAQITAVPAGPSRVGELASDTPWAELVGGDGTSSREIRIVADAPFVRLRLGRSAEPGESYLFHSDAYAEGEPLECSGLFGKPVEEAEPEIRKRFDGALTWIAPGAQKSAEPTPGLFVVEVAMTAPGRMTVFLNDTPQSRSFQSGARGSARCPVDSGR